MVDTEIIKAIEASGWLSIPSKNPYMVSWTNPFKQRLNFYFTTGTITIQNLDNSSETFRDVDSAEKAKEICSTNIRKQL